jgi:hypothetical protein
MEDAAEVRPDVGSELETGGEREERRRRVAALVGLVPARPEWSQVTLTRLLDTAATVDYADKLAFDRNYRRTYLRMMLQ